MPGEGSSVVSYGCVSSGSGVEAVQVWAEGFYVRATLTRAFSQVPGEWRARAAALRPARRPLPSCLVSQSCRDFPPSNVAERAHGSGSVHCILATSLRV